MGCRGLEKVMGGDKDAKGPNFPACGRDCDVWEGLLWASILGGGGVDGQEKLWAEKTASCYESPAEPSTPLTTQGQLSGRGGDDGKQLADCKMQSDWNGFRHFRLMIQLFSYQSFRGRYLYSRNTLGRGRFIIQNSEGKFKIA